MIELFSRATLVLAIVFALVNSTPSDANDIAYGEYLSSNCISCHSLTDTTQALPPLAGIEEQTMIDLLTVYRDNENLNQAMQTVAKSLTDEEIRALALYFAQLKP